MPGRAPAPRMADASPGMLGNFSFPRSQVPMPARSRPRPGCQPSSMTENGRLAPAGESSTIRCASTSTVSALLLPYAQYQSLWPYTGYAGSRGFGHIWTQKACSAAKADSPARPERQTTSHTLSKRSPSRTPRAPLRTSAQRLTPSGSSCQRQNARAPVRTPYAWVSEPLVVATYHGITRSGAQPRHSRSP